MPKPNRNRPDRHVIHPPTRREIDALRPLLHPSSRKPDGLAMLDRAIAHLEQVIYGRPQPSLPENG